VRKLILAALLITASCAERVDKVVVNGKDGVDGYSIVAKTLLNPEACGAAGGVEVLLALDLDRNLTFSSGDSVQTQYVTCNGTAGQNGSDGLPGSSCSVQATTNGAAITCGTSAPVMVTNGATGATGQQGPAGTLPSGAIFISAILTPCASSFVNHDEILLKLSNGKVIAVFDGGPNEDRLTFLVPGVMYRTTDHNNPNRTCDFKIDSNGNFTYQQQN